MKKFFVALVLICAGLTSRAQSDSYFLSYPTLTPDGKTVIFSFEGDLWKADLNNRQAVRLTGMPGYETHAKVSPDGKWIAFTGRQFGNADVFIIPMNGGEIKQLTFHSANDEVSAWSWDSKTIYFTSNRTGQMSGFSIPVTGGTPKRVFGDFYFQFDHNLVPHPNGEIFFNDTWESASQVHRKRYKGSFNPDIQSYNPVTKQYKKYTTWEGKDFGATIDKNGNIYFISDEANGEYNLYTFVNGKKSALTRFNTSIKTPYVNAEGGKVVFERDYQLWLYDVAKGKAEKLDIAIYRNNTLPQLKDFDVKGAVSAYDVSPDGKKLAMVSRGELFVSTADGKFVQQVKRESAERVKEVFWLNDNKTLLFSQTSGGYTNWFTIAADNSTPLKQLTKDKKNNRGLAMNKGRTKAVYLSGRDEVRLMNLKTLESKTIVRDEIWGTQYSKPGFSPNDEYVVFTAFRNFEQDIFLHNLKTSTTINLTNTGISEINPIWSPDGQYIYFTSQRVKPSYPTGANDSKVYRIALEKIDDPFRSDKLNELFDTNKKDTAKRPAAPSGVPAVITIDTDRILERIEQVGPMFGGQSLVAVIKKGEKTHVLFNSNHGEGRNALWKTVLEPFEAPKTEKIAGGDGGVNNIVEVNNTLFGLARGNLIRLNIDANRADPIALSHTFRRNLSGEFSQMFYETWAQVEENFYDGKFHGVDWNKVKQHYEKFLPHINNRSDLRILLNDMLGELNSSHQGFSTSGSDEAVPFANRTMETGIIFENDNPYIVKYVVKRSAADKKGINILPGDELIEVDNVKVDKSRNRNIYFTSPSIGSEVQLAFLRNGQRVEVKLHPQNSISNNLHDEWFDKNQQRVDEKSNNRIAYAYMKNMMAAELQQFLIDMTSELNQKDALILDLRYNTGGNVHDEVLQFLSRKTYLNWKYRDGRLSTQPHFAPSDKPIVLLINEQSLSDAEMTAAGFKALKLGTIIGNETYRWIIFTSGVGLVDGSSVRMPSWGCYSLEGDDLEMTGVKPDITVINSFEDKLNGRDPQLDRAIEEILKKLKK